MKICYLNHDLNNKTGAGRFGLSLLKNLESIRPDWNFKVLTHEDELPTSSLGWIFSFFRLRKIFKKYDVIHALDGWPYGVAATLFTKGLKKKVVITAIGTGAVQPLHKSFKKGLLGWAYKNANIVTAISNNTKREILKVLPYLKIKVINHGVDAKKFETRNPPTGRAGSKFEIVPKPYILSVGTLKKRKGYKESIIAFAGMVNKFPDLKYVIVGDGPEKKNLESSILELGLKDKVIFLNKIDEKDLISLYQNAEVFMLLPQYDKYDFEGFGLIFLEAAAAGLPVVSTKGTSAEDAVLDGENGFLVNSGFSRYAAIALIKILENKKLREKMSKNSVKFARSMSWEKAASSYLSLY